MSLIEVNMSRSQVKEKKLAVLKVVKEKKEILFGSFQNNAVNKKEKEEAWLEVLMKAQSLELTSANRQWSYARDHLFGLWKSRTLAKRDNLRKTGSGGRRAIVLDEVDEEILNILEKNTPVVGGLGLTKTDGIITSPPVHPQQLFFSAQQSCKQQQQQRGTKRKTKDSLDNIKKDILETELYINKLKILKMEKELGLPTSKFTLEFQNHNSIKKSP